MAERKISFKIEALGTDQVSKQIADLEKDMISFANERKKLRKEAKEGRISEDELAKGLANLKVKQQQASKEQAKLRKEFVAGQKVAKGLSGSYNDLVLETNLLRQRLKDLPDGFNETSQEANELKKQIKENTDKLKDFDKELGDNFRNVGNYTDAIKEAFAGTNVFGTAIQNVGNFYERFTGVVKVAKESTNKFSNAQKAGAVSSTLFSKALNFLKIALISTGIGAIVVLLGSLVAFFTKSKDGSDKFSIALAYLGGIVDGLVKAFSALGGFLIDIFTDPSNAVDNFSERLDNATESASRAVKIKQLEIAMKDLTIQTKLATAELEHQVSVLELASEDATTSLGDQRQATLDLLDAKRKLTEVSVKQAKAEEELAKEKFEQAKGTDEQREAELAYAEAKEKSTRASNDLILFEKNAEKTLRQIKSDRLEQELDFLIDGFDKQKSINERKIKDETLTENQRRALLAETQRLGKKSFDEQIAVLQSVAKEQIDANDLINESDSKLLFEKAERLGLSEILTKRLLEIVNERKIAEQDFAEASKELEKSITDTKQKEQDKRNKADQKNAEAGIELQKLKAGEDIALLEEALIAERDLKLANEELTANERLLIEAQYQDQIAKLKEDARLKDDESELKDREAELALKRLQAGEDIALLTEVLEAERDLKLENDDLTANERLLIEAEYQEKINKLGNKAVEDEKARAQARNEIYQSFFETAGGALSEFILDQNVSFKKFGKTVILNALEVAQKLINVKLAEITAQSLAQADSVATFGASGLLRASILTGLVNGAFNVAKAKIGKFEQGGLVNGPSHANGGVKFAVGGQVNELEGGEAVINKRSTSMFGPILSALNVAGGGKKFAQGGIINDARLSSLSGLGSSVSSITNINNSISDDVVQRIGEAVRGNLKVTNVVTETSTQINKVNNIQNEASI